MTTPQRAKRLSGLILDPVMGKTVEIIFGQCGNCLHRVRCSSRMVNVRLAMRMLSQGERNPLPPSRYSRTAATILKDSCGKCDQLEICLHVWGNANGCEQFADPAAKFIKEITQLPEEELARILEGYLKALRLSGAKLISRAATMWWKCDRDKAYVTTTMVCLEGMK